MSAIYEAYITPNGAWSMRPKNESECYNWELVALLLNDLINSNECMD